MYNKKDYLSYNRTLKSFDDNKRVLKIQGSFAYK